MMARDLVVVEGPDAVSYVHSQVTQDVTGMAVGESRWTFVLEPTGKVVVLARLTRTADTRLELDTDAGYGQLLLDRLNRFKIRVAADTSLHPGAGPDDEPDDVRVARGWPKMGAELVPGETLVAGSGLERVAVSFTKGCYPGQELVERMDSRVVEPPRSLRRLPAGDYDPAVVEVTSVTGDVALGWVKRGNDLGEPVVHPL